ncbi:hypothetical protein [Paracoccus suum]|uniref:hypothetical protein n=1 Tax=Paracoccus suum TaxID=2259340 RepID=UPI0013B05AF6|nr:hypothetical protein [Paracoccus suum]
MGELLANLEVELGGLARRCRSLEDTAAIAAGQSQGDPMEQSRLVVAFQELDLLTQSLGDLARLAGAAGGSGLARFPVDTDMVRHSLRLTGLAERLLGQPQNQDDPPGLELFL